MSNDRIFLACRDCKEKTALLAKEWGGWIGDTCEVWHGVAAALDQFFKVDHASCSVNDFYLTAENGDEIRPEEPRELGSDLVQADLQEKQRIKRELTNQLVKDLERSGELNTILSSLATRKS